MKDQVLVFTGFRDKDLEQKIIEAGGQVKTSVSSNTTILVCKDETVKNGDSGKIKDAKRGGEMLRGSFSVSPGEFGGDVAVKEHERASGAIRIDY